MLQLDYFIIVSEVCTWIFSISYLTPIVYIPISQKSIQDIIDSGLELFLIPVPLIIICVVCFAFLLIAVCIISYFVIFISIYKQSQKVFSLNDNKQASPDLTRVKKTSKTMAILLGVMLLCWLPLLCWNTYLILNVDKYQYVMEDPFLSYLDLVIFLGGYLNSFINPFIYAVKIKEFRRGYLSVLCCGRYKSS